MSPDIDVTVREVGMRDGLQSIATIMPTAEKQRWCREELAAGVREIEVCSFVPPKLLPQFQDAVEICSYALGLAGLTVATLVPNLKGAERAIAAGVHKIGFPMSVSESHSRSNVRRSVHDSVAEFVRICELVRTVDPGRRPKVSGGLATAFGCTIEGPVAEARVVALAADLAKAGADEVVVADTVGYAAPTAIRRVFSAVRAALGRLPVAAHFHDTRGLGLANVLAALEVGVRAFDASLGGFGGCPYAPGATGNIATEDLVFMLESMGLRTGVSLPRLLAVRAANAKALPGEAFHGAISVAGLPKGFVPASRLAS